MVNWQGSLEETKRLIIKDKINFKTIEKYRFGLRKT